MWSTKIGKTAQGCSLFRRHRQMALRDLFVYAHSRRYAPDQAATSRG